MAATIYVYNNGRRVGMTSKAFNCVTKEELMREYTLAFDIINTDSIYQYIDENSSFKNNGQMFDVIGIDGESGKNNTTQIQAEHVSYRLNNYNVPFGYSFVGTVAEIVQDMLNQSYAIINDDWTTDANYDFASQEFTVGTCADLGTLSFSLGNEQDLVLKDAILRISRLGVEVDYDNFTLNFPVRIGSDTGKEFRFGHDLVSFRKRWTLGNGWTYDVSIANLQRIPGHEGDTFKKGDTVTITNGITGESIKKRIITYNKCEDDPRQDSIVLGVFIRDSADDAIATEITADTALNKADTAQDTADAAKATADNSVQQGESYSNVSIDHTHGFMAALQDGSVRVVMNGNDCFAVQVPDGDGWKTIQQLTNAGLGATSLSMIGYPNFKAIVGKGPNPNDGLGLFIIDTNYSTEPFAKIWRSALGDTVIDGTGDLLLRCGADKTIHFRDTDDNEYGDSANHHVPSDGTYPGYTMHFVKGIYTGWTID